MKTIFQQKSKSWSENYPWSHSYRYHAVSICWPHDRFGVVSNIFSTPPGKLFTKFWDEKCFNFQIEKAIINSNSPMLPTE